MDPKNTLDAIILLLAGLGILLVGFKLLSDNIEKLANTGLKKLFNKTSQKYIVGVGIGALATAVIQSSAASTVMVVGFVNAGIMNLYQATAMIMGANIGTTVTAQIASLGSFDFTKYAMILAVIGMFMYMIIKKDKIKTLGLALSGLGMVFIALKMMCSSMVIFQESEQVSNFLISCNNPFLLLLFGIVFTALIQSSSAVTTILISMVAAGMSIGNPGSNGILYVVLGSNIGTCITALLSSIGASTNAKRASLIHLLFNVTGSLLFVIVLLLWPSFMQVTFARWFDVPATQIAMFHTFFNVLCTLLFLPFIKVFVKISEFTIKDKSKKFTLTYIDDRFLKTPGIALSQASKETLRLGKLSLDTLSLSIKAFTEKSFNYNDEIRENMKNIEELNQQLLKYLIKVSALDISNESEATISTLHQIIGDFYREVEIADNMMKYTKYVIDNDLAFSDKVYSQIKEMKEKLLKQFDNVNELFSSDNKEIINDIDKLEDEIDNLRSTMTSQHIARLEANECSPASSGVFINLVSNLERAGDHLSYIAHNILDNR